MARNKGLNLLEQRRTGDYRNDNEVEHEKTAYPNILLDELARKVTGRPGYLDGGFPGGYPGLLPRISSLTGGTLGMGAGLMAGLPAGPLAAGLGGTAGLLGGTYAGDVGARAVLDVEQAMMAKIQALLGMAKNDTEGQEAMKQASGTEVASLRKEALFLPISSMVLGARTGSRNNPDNPTAAAAGGLLGGLAGNVVGSFGMGAPAGVLAGLLGGPAAVPLGVLAGGIPGSLLGAYGGGRTGGYVAAELSREMQELLGMAKNDAEGQEAMKRASPRKGSLADRFMPKQAEESTHDRVSFQRSQGNAPVSEAFLAQAQSMGEHAGRDYDMADLHEMSGQTKHALLAGMDAATLGSLYGAAKSPEHPFAGGVGGFLGGGLGALGGGAAAGIPAAALGGLLGGMGGPMGAAGGAALAGIPAGVLGYLAGGAGGAHMGSDLLSDFVAKRIAMQEKQGSALEKQAFTPLQLIPLSLGAGLGLGGFAGGALGGPAGALAGSALGGMAGGYAPLLYEGWGPGGYSEANVWKNLPNRVAQEMEEHMADRDAAMTSGDPARVKQWEEGYQQALRNKAYAEEMAAKHASPNLLIQALRKTAEEPSPAGKALGQVSRGEGLHPVKPVDLEDRKTWPKSQRAELRRSFGRDMQDAQQAQHKKEIDRAAGEHALKRSKEIREAPRKLLYETLGYGGDKKPAVLHKQQPVDLRSMAVGPPPKPGPVKPGLAEAARLMTQPSAKLTDWAESLGPDGLTSTEFETAQRYLTPESRDHLWNEGVPYTYFRGATPATSPGRRKEGSPNLLIQALQTLAQPVQHKQASQGKAAQRSSVSRNSAVLRSSATEKRAFFGRLLSGAKSLGGSALGALKTPMGAGFGAGALGLGAGYLGGREHLQEQAEGPFLAMTQPDMFVPSLLEGMSPQQQQQILSDPRAMQMLTQQVQQEGMQMLGEKVVD